MDKTIKTITRTAVLLAITVLFQSLRLLIPMPQAVNQYLTGSLVNLCLILGAVTIGIKSGLVIAVAAPVIAFLQGFTPPFPVLVLLIAAGNIVLVLIAGLLYMKNAVLTVIISAVAKFLALYILVVKLGTGLLLAKAPDKVRAALSIQFSWPQLVTALIGGFISLGVVKLLQKVIKN